VNDVDNEDRSLVLNGVGRKMILKRETNGDVILELFGSNGESVEYFLDSIDRKMIVGFFKGCR
jgi:hypothetical protein